MAKEKTKFVEQLKDAQKGKEIWVIGCGASLNDFPADFFDDKISIAINGSIFKYPNATYWHGHHENWREYFRDERPDLLEKCLIPYPFPGPFPHKTARDPLEFFGEKASLPYWMYFLDSTVLSKREIEAPIKEIIAGKPKISFRCCQTVFHMAVELAFLMGAGKITAVGSEHREFPGRKPHADIGIPYPWGGRWNTMPKVIETTVWLAEILAEQGIEMQRYYNADTLDYSKGYEQITKDLKG